MSIDDIIDLTYKTIKYGISQNKKVSIKIPCHFQVSGARASVSKPIEYTEEYFYWNIIFN